MEDETTGLSTKGARGQTPGLRKHQEIRKFKGEILAVIKPQKEGDSNSEIKLSKCLAKSTLCVGHHNIARRERTESRSYTQQIRLT